MILNGLNTLEEASRENDALSRRRSDVYDWTSKNPTGNVSFCYKW